MGDLAVGVQDLQHRQTALDALDLGIGIDRAPGAHFVPDDPAGDTQRQHKEQQRTAVEQHHVQWGRAARYAPARCLA